MLRRPSSRHRNTLVGGATLRRELQGRREGLEESSERPQLFAPFCQSYRG